jgi:glycolate oxidase
MLEARDIKELEKIAGPKNVIITKEKMEDYSHDEVPILEIRQYPDVVVKPEDSKQISEILKYANSKKIPVTPRGGGTGLSGGCIPLSGGIILSFENMNRILEIDRENFMAVLEPGVTLADFYIEAEKAGLFFPPHPGDESATFGGLVATNAGGARAIKYGTIRNFVRGLEVVLPDGEIINFGGKLFKDSSGYNFLNLMIGSEGTLGIITKIIISLSPPPGKIYTLVIPYNNLNQAIETVPQIFYKGIIPMALEFIEEDIIVVTESFTGKKWPYKGVSAYLMIIVDSNSESELDTISENIAEVCLEKGAVDVFVAENRQKQNEILEIRSKVYEALKPQTLEILDVVVPRAEIAEHVMKIKEISRNYGMWLPTYGHAGDGNVHTHLMKTTEGWKEKVVSIRKEIYSDAISRGGKISGEHGIGIMKKEDLSLFMKPIQLKLMKQIKKTFDPYNILNPGKIFDI